MFSWLSKPLDILHGRSPSVLYGFLPHSGFPVRREKYTRTPGGTAS